MGVIAGDDAYGRGGANIFADKVLCTSPALINCSVNCC